MIKEKEWVRRHGDITYLYRIERGATGRTYCHIERGEFSEMPWQSKEWVFVIEDKHFVDFGEFDRMGYDLHPYE